MDSLPDTGKWFVLLGCKVNHGDGDSLVVILVMASMLACIGAA